jgi:hypothetical protein
MVGAGCPGAVSAVNAKRPPRRAAVESAWERASQWAASGTVHHQQRVCCAVLGFSVTPGTLADRWR